MCKRFFDHCQHQGIQLAPAGNFTLSYTTTIPRQASGVCAKRKWQLGTYTAQHGMS